MVRIAASGAVEKQDGRRAFGTPRTVTINEALEIARRFSTYEATQFINGILDAIKRDLDEQQPQQNVQPETEDESALDPSAEPGDSDTESDLSAEAEE